MNPYSPPVSDAATKQDDSAGTPTPWQSILDFWFYPPTHPEYGQTRAEWFRKNADFDREIANRFGSLLEFTLSKGTPFQAWPDTPEAQLARIVLLDQFTRNSFRDTAKAFAGDALALQTARALVASGQDRTLLPVQRWFAWMPFEHAEQLAMQTQSVALFSQLAQEVAGFDGVLDYAKKHYDVVARFGRFPHRNSILGRSPTPEEVAFLLQPGSRF
jgi:uncharacterized protein (DUF924 family)